MGAGGDLFTSVRNPIRGCINLHQDIAQFIFSVRIDDRIPRKFPT